VVGGPHPPMSPSRPPLGGALFEICFRLEQRPADLECRRSMSYTVNDIDLAWVRAIRGAASIEELHEVAKAI